MPEGGVKVILERPLCIGCSNCAQVCPEFWEMAEDGFSHLKGSGKEGENEEREFDEAGCNMQAAEECPATCIHIEKGGKRIL